MAANQVNLSYFNPNFQYPYALRQLDFQVAMQDVYDFFEDVNAMLGSKGLQRLDDMMRPANLSGTISDMVTDSIAKGARGLVPNQHHNGHPDLLQRGQYVNDAVESGTEGIEVKSTLKPGGAVDTHGARDQWMCVFVYSVDNDTQPASARGPLTFREVYLAEVVKDDFRLNSRNTATGTRTATLHRDGVKKLRSNWIYLDPTWHTPTHDYLSKLANRPTS